MFKKIIKVMNDFGEDCESFMFFLMMVFMTAYIIIYVLNLDIKMGFRIFIVVFISFSFACYGLRMAGMFNLLGNGEEKKNGRNKRNKTKPIQNR